MSMYRFEHHRVDADRRELMRGRQIIPLSQKVFDLLLCLMRAGGRTVTKDELIADVWGQEEAAEATLVQHVSVLRRLLGERSMGCKYILTVPRVGYRFVPNVEHIARPASVEAD